VLGGLAGFRRGETVKARPGVGVQIEQRFVLLRHIAKDLHQRGVLENIGVVAGVEGVAVTQHRRVLVWVAQYSEIVPLRQ